MATLDTILKQIDLVFKDIEQKRESAQGLLENANRLSTIMYNLSDLWVTAKTNSDTAKLSYDEKFDEVFFEQKTQHKVSDETAKAVARIESREFYSSYLTKEHLQRKLFALRSDIDRKISVIQSYAAELRSQFAARKGGEPT